MHEILLPVGGANFPPAISRAGPKAERSFLEFFAARIRNRNTRDAYARAVGVFCRWCDDRQIPLQQLGPVEVAGYIEQLGTLLAPPSVKQHLAALRVFFDHLVLQHLVERNPCHGVRGPKYVVERGLTPVIESTEARTLLDSIETTNFAGLRDRALIAIMLYTFARVSAVVRLNRGDYHPRGKRMKLRFCEKGSKIRLIPCASELEEILDAYLDGAGLRSRPPDAPLFVQLRDRSKQMTRFDAFGAVRTRAKAAGIDEAICNHTFRATGITTYLRNGGSIENAQAIAGHTSPTTTKLYDRRSDEIDFAEVERIRI